MDTLLEALREALRLLTEFDPALREVVGMTLRVTGGALLLAIVIGLPLGAALGLRNAVPAAGCLMPIIYTGMGLPPVVVGLFVYLILSNQGPLGPLRWLFTPRAMIAAQTIIALLDERDALRSEADRYRKALKEIAAERGSWAVAQRALEQS